MMTGKREFVRRAFWEWTRRKSFTGIDLRNTSSAIKLLRSHSPCGKVVPQTVTDWKPQTESTKSLLQLSFRGRQSESLVHKAFKNSGGSQISHQNGIRNKLSLHFLYPALVKWKSTYLRRTSSFCDDELGFENMTSNHSIFQAEKTQRHAKRLTST